MGLVDHQHVHLVFDQGPHPGLVFGVGGDGGPHQQAFLLVDGFIGVQQVLVQPKL